MDIFTAPDRDPGPILTTGLFNGKQVGLEVAVKNLAVPTARPRPGPITR